MSDLAKRVRVVIEQRLSAASRGWDDPETIRLRRDLAEIIDHDRPHPPEASSWTCGTARHLARRYEVPEATKETDR